MARIELAPLEPAVAEERLGGADLSDWFGPFLPTFVRESVGSGGSAWLAEEQGHPCGLATTDPVERTASVFSRSATVVRALSEAAGAPSVYAELAPPGLSERYGIYAAPLDALPTHRFRHPVAPVGPSAADEVGGLLTELYGASPDRWFPVARAEGERCFGVRADGRLVGVAWVLVRGARARLHGLSVRAGYRRVGIGSDLVGARLAYARSRGARLAFSEIADRNLASRATSERAGLRPAGQLFLWAVPRPATTGGAGPDA